MDAVIIVFVFKALVFAEQILAEGHRVRPRLVAAGQAPAVITVAVDVPAGDFGVQLGFIPVIVLVMAQFVIA